MLDIPEVLFPKLNIFTHSVCFSGTQSTRSPSLSSFFSRFYFSPFSMSPWWLWSDEQQRQTWGKCVKCKQILFCKVTMLDTRDLSALYFCALKATYKTERLWGQACKAQECINALHYWVYIFIQFCPHCRWHNFCKKIYPPAVLNCSQPRPTNHQ